MSKTSAIDHPKYEYCLTVHSWQFKACNQNLYAALLLAYLEDKFNLLLQSENKNKGWMKLNKFQIQHAIFTDNYEDIESAFEILRLLIFVELNPVSVDFPRKENEIWIKLNAKQINLWLDIYKDKEVDKMDLLNYMPFLMLVLFVTPEPEVVEKVVEKVKTIKEREKFTESDLTFVARANIIFEFWKWITGSTGSKVSEKFLKMIINRIKENYTDYQLAHAVYGLIPRMSDPKLEKYIGVKYVFGDSEKVDRMIKDAEKAGFDAKLAEDEFDEISQAVEYKEEIGKRDNKLDNKNKSTGANLV